MRAGDLPRPAVPRRLGASEGGCMKGLFLDAGTESADALRIAAPEARAEILEPVPLN